MLFNRLISGIFLALLFLFVHIAFSQTTLLQESFETDGESSRYTSNSGNDAGLSDVWERTNSLPHSYHSTTMSTGTMDGSYYWVAEDTYSLLSADAHVTLNALDVSSYENLTVTVAVAISRHGQNRWERDDVVAIEYNMDGGGWNTIGLFSGNNASPGLGGALFQDSDATLSTFGTFTTEVTGTFADFTFSVGATGSSLQVRLRVDCNGSEELGVDNIVIEGDLVTPVDWLGFEVVTSGTQSQLLWEVASEENNEGFGVERAEKSEWNAQANFQELAFVAGRGSSTTPYRYTHTIEHQPNGHYLYRLRQVDFDGKFSYSDVVESAVEHDKMLTVFPNPFSNQIQIAMIEAEEEILGLALFNSKGESVPIPVSHQASFHLLNTSHLPPGLYLLVIKSSQAITRKKMLKI
ncbi:MAG: T9SS type A sorting domain-containing protein [Bacteroidota bacterium]